eukprot:TRINITY_DN174_c0_g1_i6.p3 TRINITY_DN174_c0_g1~~TRINITY_DN174_c0_g1_i6.p3  ORF type:complete len:233 (+),score=-9.71 TRINITY_DN174_c0_g1_i6:440-1138(+)
MAAFELLVSEWVAGDPADVGNADNVAVQVSLENTGAASRAASIDTVVFITTGYIAVSSCLDLGGLLQVLSVGVHLGQHGADPVVLDAEFLDPLLVVCSCLVGHGHILELSFLGEVDVVHGACSAGWPGAIDYVIPYFRIPADRGVVPVELPLGFELSPLGDYVAGSGLFLYQLLAVKASLGGNDHLYVLVSNALDRCLLVHVVGCTGHADYGHGDNNQNSYGLSHFFPTSTI